MVNGLALALSHFPLSDSPNDSLSLCSSNPHSLSLSLFIIEAFMAKWPTPRLVVGANL